MSWQREMSKNFQDRTNLEKEMKKRQQENERAKQQIIELRENRTRPDRIFKISFVE